MNFYPIEPLMKSAHTVLSGSVFERMEKPPKIFPMFKKSAYINFYYFE